MDEVCILTVFCFRANAAIFKLQHLTCSSVQVTRVELKSHGAQTEVC